MVNSAESGPICTRGVDNPPFDSYDPCSTVVTRDSHGCTVMTATEIDYAARMRRSLLGLVRDLLTDTAKDGLPGDHHFYLTFDTTHAGVAIPDHLKARHPATMTIVLQHQYWDLIVEEDWFSVKLSFNGKQENLTVPFEALTSFVDPSVQFGLPLQDAPSERDFVDLSEEKAEAPVEDELPAEAEAAAAEDAESGETEDNVITLDRFRKP